MAVAATPERARDGLDEERWGVAHYHTLTVLFAAYAVGMYAKGAMSLGVFGMSKVRAMQATAEQRSQ